MPRRNTRAGLPRRQKRSWMPQEPAPPKPRGRKPGTPIAVADLVVPAGRCGRGKLYYVDEATAERALRQAVASRTNRGLVSQETRIYGDCDAFVEGLKSHWHLTSRKTYHPRETP